MIKKVSLLLALQLILSVNFCHAQTPAKVSELLKKSKFVDTGREVNTVLSPGLATISTFSHPQASDRDCKVTALLMMKELRQNFGSIHRIRVLFYDPADVSSYREVNVKGSDAALVDGGSPLQTVLGKIAVARHAVPRRAGASRALAHSSYQSGGSRNRSGYLTFQSADGNVSILYPDGWVKDPNETSSLLLRLTTLRSNTVVTITMLRLAPPLSMSPETLATQREHEAQTKYRNYVQRVRRAQSFAGYPGIYFEASAEILSNTPTVERSAFIDVHGSLYTLTMQATSKADSEMSQIFETMISSLELHG